MTMSNLDPEPLGLDPKDAMEVDPAERETESTSRSTTISSHTSEPSQKELDRWKLKAKDLEDQRDALSKQLQELMQVRKTEPEQILEQLRIQYDERAQAQDALIKELTSQLVLLEPLSHTRQTSALHFLTREAADEERRAAEQDMLRLQEVIKEKDALIDGNVKRIAELKQSVEDALRERDAEIEKSKELLAQAAPKSMPNAHATRPKRPFSVDDPKTTEVIKFYEDMSNLLITNVKFEQVAGSEEPDIVFHCVYTYYEMTARRGDAIEGDRIGIDFTMRLFNGFEGPNNEPASKDDAMHRRIRYTPLHLDKEPAGFVKKLDYMGESFTFPCAQQGLFLTSLHEKIRDASGEAID